MDLPQLLLRFSQTASNGCDPGRTLGGFVLFAVEAAQLSLGISLPARKYSGPVVIFLTRDVTASELSRSIWTGNLMDYGLLSSILHAILVASTLPCSLVWVH